MKNACIFVWAAQCTRGQACVVEAVGQFPLKQHLANNNNVVGGFDAVFLGLPVQNCKVSCIHVPPTTIENTQIGKWEYLPKNQSYLILTDELSASCKIQIDVFIVRHEDRPDFSLRSMQE